MPIRYTPEYHDHVRDLRKAEPRPGERDYVPLHAQSAPLSTSMDIAICVRGMKNIQDAAALIDRYVEARAAEQRLDAVAAGARP
jgi:hypothetical protein